MIYEIFCAVLLITGLLLMLWQLSTAMFTKVQWYSPHNKTVLITGCDSGIGLQLALHFYQKGCIVFAACLSPASDGANALRQLCTDNDRIHVIQMNVTNDDHVNDAYKYIENYLRRNNLNGLWSLINNAGICVCGEFDWYTWDQCQSQIDINLMGTIRVTKCFTPLIIKGKGRIINVSSVNGQCAYPGISVYCATKYAIIGFSDSIRLELSRYGVKVIVIKPGDFTKLTNICGQQREHFSVMWECMDSDKKKFYGDCFTRYQNYILNNIGVTSPESFEKSNLLLNFEEAILAVDPRTYITSATFFIRFCLSILQVIPIDWRDAILYSYLSKMLKVDANKVITQH